MRNGNGTASILYIREGVTKGYPLVMITYGISILPLIKNLKQEIPKVTQPRYVDDAGALGTFVKLHTYFNFLKRQVQGRGYHPKLSKSVLIVHLYNLEAV